MELQVGKWGNSLALRLPAELARQLNVTEGAALDVTVSATGVATLKSARPPFDKAAYMKRVKALTDNMAMTEPVVEQMRANYRY